MKHIYGVFAINNLILSTTLAFTPRSVFVLRVVGVGAAGVLLAYIQFAIPTLEGNRLPQSLLLTPFWILFIRATHLILLPSEHQFPVPVKSAAHLPKGFSQTAATSLLNLWAFRTVPRVITNIPSFSDTEKNYIPSRAKFLAITAAKLAISWLIIELSYVAPPPDIEAAFAVKHQETLSRLGEITVEEAATRVFTCMFAGMGVWAIFTGFYSASALVFVGCNLSAPSSWPPLFGSLRDAWSLRRFWGLSWHQTFRTPFEDTSEFVLSRSLRLSKTALISRYLTSLLAFSLCGLAHFLSDIALGIPASESGSLVFFTMQPLAIAFEVVIQTLCRRYSFHGMWTYWIGYAWVTLFLLWSAPGWIYPTIRHQRWGMDFMLPCRFLS